MGWVILAYLGLEGLGVFVVFVCECVFSFVQVLFLFSLALFFCCWIAVGFLVFFLFFGFVFLVLFFFWEGLFFVGGFKGQVRWPKGPPHLALNPPYHFGGGAIFWLS